MLFSVVIFTKGRSQIVASAVQSILNQTCSDFELVIADNDDTETTSKTLASFSDPRVRYLRTGNLSMVDNWEAGVALTQGEYVLSLTDRCQLKPFALERIKQAIESYREDVFVWWFDYLADKSNEVVHPESKPVEVVSSQSLLEWFLTQPYGVYNAQLPRGLNSCHSRSLLNKIKDVHGRLFLPVCPDYTHAFVALANSERVVMLNESLFIWAHHHLSNGEGPYRSPDTLKRFLRDSNLTEEDLYNEVPIKTVGIHNVVCNDLLRLKHVYPGLPDLPLVPYFVICRREIDEWLVPQDAAYSEKVTAWESALSKQSAEIQQEVLARLFPRVTWYQRIYRPIYNSSIARKARQTLSTAKVLS